MAINAIGNTNQQSTYYSSAAKTEDAAKKTAEQTQDAAKKNEAGAVYEKSSSSASDSTVTKKSNSAIVEKMKADMAQRTEQLRSLVEKMMTKQGEAIGNADSMWSFLAKGNFTVDAATRAQAQADIAEDGYWGVEQTSDRILDFAKALSGDDPDKADELLAAFDKGFKQATKSWGKDLPDISQRTYDAVHEKFDQWKKGSEVAEAAQTQA